MTSPQTPIHISDFASRVYRHEQMEKWENIDKTSPYDAFLDYIAKRVGMRYGDAEVYIVRAAHGCQWGKWTRHLPFCPINASHNGIVDCPDITDIAK